MSGTYLTTNVVSHAGNVCRLYKASIRNLQSFYLNRSAFRIKAVELRARFDENAGEIDMVKAKNMLKMGQQELDTNMHPMPLKFTYSPGGISYGREPKFPDYIYDTWHPYERAAYPEYFERRHQRKLEYIEAYDKKYPTEKTQ